jgi:acetolactate synthase I/II/III large subunit
MLLTGAQLVVKIMENMKIEKLAGLPGGANLPLYNALYESNIEHILARHEQGAGFIAHGIARSTGKTGVCIVTSGPGLTNALTAIADAKLDSVPIVFISGQVPFSNIGKDSFQEVDTYSLTIPITKHNFLVRHVSELKEKLCESFRIAAEGRPGPVVIDIPKDVLNQKIEVDVNLLPNHWKIETPESPVLDEDIQKIAEMIKTSKKPILYVGGGAIKSDVTKELLELAHKNHIPVTSTLMGLGCFPPEDSLYLGMLGMHGARYTNFLMQESDLLLAFGVRFDDRATGNMERFCPHAKVVHVDIERAEINKNRVTDHFMVASLEHVMPKLVELVDADQRAEWVNRVNELKEQYPLVYPPVHETYSPVNLMLRVARTVERDSIVTTDVGQHQMWVAQVYPFVKPRQLLTSGGLGTMGFGLPAAIGAAIENPDKKVICFTGDGSFLMNIQEMALLAELNLNVKVIMFNNNCLGMVRQQQELFYGQNYMASIYSHNGSFTKVSEGFGVKSVVVQEELENIHEFDRMIEGDGPCFIECVIRQESNVFPIVPPGSGNDEMLGGDRYE